MRRDIFKFIRKINSGDINFTLPVVKDGAVEAFLRPITRNLKDYEVKLLSDWRAKNQHVFKDPNPITIEGTRRWFLDTHKDRRLLFFIESTSPIGHIGIYRIDPEDDSLEIDNVIRGTSEKKGIMHLSLAALISWAKKVLKPKNIYLKVAERNTHAIEFYKKNGFVIAEEVEFRSEPHYKMRYEELLTTS